MNDCLYDTDPTAPSLPPAALQWDEDYRQFGKVTLRQGTWNVLGRFALLIVAAAFGV